MSQHSTRADATAGSAGPAWRGRDPHPLDRQLAALNRDVYAREPSCIDGWHPLSAIELDRTGIAADVLVDAGSGFHSRLYLHPGHGYALVMRGTDEVRDWRSNVRQGFGVDDAQYRQAAIAASHARQLLDGGLVVTGHSLGGGLAAFASLRAGVPAVTFNATGIHDRTLARHGITPDVRRFAAASGHVRAYSVRDDIVTALHREDRRFGPLLPDPIGHAIGLHDPDPLGVLDALPPLGGLRQGLHAHSIDAVLRAFDAPDRFRDHPPSPGARLLSDALRGLRLVEATRGSGPLPMERLLDLSVSLAARAYEQGLRRIDHVAASADGDRLFAFEGQAGDPAQRRAGVDVARAACPSAPHDAATLRATSAEAPALPLPPRIDWQQVQHAMGR